jgi:chromosome segregation ATPase
MTERLDRIEAILEKTAQKAKADTAAIEADRSAIAQLRSTINSLVQVVEIYQRNHEATQRNFERIVTEIREIRIESQSILEHLFGKQENGEGWA